MTDEADNCAEHPGAWHSDCPTCEAVRNAVIARYGEWNLGDSGECDFTNLVVGTPPHE